VQYEECKVINTGHSSDRVTGSAANMYSRRQVGLQLMSATDNGLLNVQPAGNTTVFYGHSSQSSSVTFSLLDHSGVLPHHFQLIIHRED
jgi:hypothetical protein